VAESLRSVKFIRGQTSRLFRIVIKAISVILFGHKRLVRLLA